MAFWNRPGRSSLQGAELRQPQPQQTWSAAWEPPGWSLIENCRGLSGFPASSETVMATSDRRCGLRRPPDTARMARKPEPPKPATWNVYRLAAKAVRFGSVEAHERLGIELTSAWQVERDPVLYDRGPLELISPLSFDDADRADSV
jgi:hypothetical protein